MRPILPFDPARRPSVAAHLGAPRRTDATPPAVVLAFRALRVSPGELTSLDYTRHASVYAVLRLARGFYRSSGMSIAGVRLRLTYLSAELFLGAFGRSLPSDGEVSLSLAWLQSRGVAEEVSPGQWREREECADRGVSHGE